MRKIPLILSFVILLICLFNSCEHVPDSITLVPPGGSDPGNNGGATGGAGQPCSSDTVYFRNQVLPLLISSCAKSGCHDAASHEDGVEMTSYEKIMTTGGVEPGDPDDSELYEVIIETDLDERMPRPPSDPLTAAEKQIIYKWILQGAKNNACDDCDTSTITWSGAVLPIINTNCKGCHNPTFLSGGLDLTAHANVRNVALSGKLMGSIDHLPGFPPMPMGAAKLDNCKITQIRNWINAGALNN